MRDVGEHPNRAINLPSEIAKGWENPSDRIVQNELSLAIRPAIDELKEPYRTILRLKVCQMDDEAIIKMLMVRGVREN